MLVCEAGRHIVKGPRVSQLLSDDAADHIAVQQYRSAPDVSFPRSRCILPVFNSERTATSPIARSPADASDLLEFAGWDAFAKDGERRSNLEPSVAASPLGARA